ncbi:inositol oxygenase-like [Liolophura sinensis]|uniref:inositol oxygenase-like n=1 Tax=Liolophura sinensis TaxID=3198878 RepID=UPI00315919BF
MSVDDIFRHRSGRVSLFDLSEYRPEYKNTEDFRNFAMGVTPDHVIRSYRHMHQKQTLKFATEKKQEWCQLNHARMTVMEALEALNSLMDESDPDADVSDGIHAFQTAEGIRREHPDKDWLQLTGLIHDIGKIMVLWGEPQWAVVGDSYPVGCAPSDAIVFGRESFAGNPDLDNDTLNTKLGIYEENCGLSDVTMTWGHDAYLYHVMRQNTCYLPEEAYYIVRFHSFYPWHTSGAYDYLCNNKDREMLSWVLEFNKFDLYTKSPNIPDLDELTPYYQGLIDKYLPGKLRF